MEESDGNRRESSFSHKFRIGQEIKFPEGHKLRKGKIEKVIFEKHEISGDGEIIYEITPWEAGAREQSIQRAEEDVIGR